MGIYDTINKLEELRRRIQLGTTLSIGSLIVMPLFTMFAPQLSFVLVVSAFLIFIYVMKKVDKDKKEFKSIYKQPL